METLIMFRNLVHRLRDLLLVTLLLNLNFVITYIKQRYSKICEQTLFYVGSQIM